MKNIWQYILMGIVVALGGLFVSDLVGNFFNGMDYGSGCVLGICMYLCAVVVTCTGVVLMKLRENTNSGNANREEKD